MRAPTRPAPEPSAHTDSGDAAVGGRQDRRSRENRLKDKNRELRKDQHDEDFDEATATPEPEARTVPAGMKPEQFKRFADALHAGFAELDIHDVVAVVQGSGATNRSHKHGAPFDEARVSDYDVALVSPTLVKRADEFHIKLSGPLSEQDISMLGFRGVLIQLRHMTERPVNFKLMRGTDLPEGIRVP